MTPGKKSTFTSIGTPSLSFAMSILKAERTIAMVRKSEASTSSTPGQIRSPKPNTICFGSNSGLLPKNRPGLNDPGSLYVFGSMGCNGV